MTENTQNVNAQLQDIIQKISATNMNSDTNNSDITKLPTSIPSTTTSSNITTLENRYLEFGKLMRY